MSEVTIPESIPSDGSRNVRKELLAFIAAQPDGTTIRFPRSNPPTITVYLMDPDDDAAGADTPRDTK